MHQSLEEETQRVEREWQDDSKGMTKEHHNISETYNI